MFFNQLIIIENIGILFYGFCSRKLRVSEKISFLINQFLSCVSPSISQKLS